MEGMSFPSVPFDAFPSSAMPSAAAHCHPNRGRWPLLRRLCRMMELVRPRTLPQKQATKDTRKTRFNLDQPEQKGVPV
jgi:hypothetical protein